MTDPEKRIEALVHTVPTVEKTKSQRWLLTGAAGFAVMSIAALVLSLVSIYSTARVAACTNTNLGTRSVPTANDARAHIEFAKAVEGLFLPPTASPADRAAAVELFKTATKAYVLQLEADQASREAHPLGRC